MYSPKQMLIQTFISYLQTTYQTVFGHEPSHYRDFLGSIAHMALGLLTRSDALYHDLEHTILVTSVGQEIMRAKRLLEGGRSVTPEDWSHFISALLCHDIGYLKGVCCQDDWQAGRFATGTNEEFILLPVGSTDAALTAYHVDRSKQFVKEQFQDDWPVTVETVLQIIEFTRFPVPPADFYQDTKQLPGLARAADLIGQLSDHHYLNKLPALFYEFEQAGTNRTLGYQHPDDMRSGFSRFYWHGVYPYVQDAIAYLNQTQSGQQIVAALNANVFDSERPVSERSMVQLRVS